MPKLQSIKQNHMHDALPDFRSLGVALRTLLLANGMALLLALLRASSWTDILPQLLQSAAMLQPALLSCQLLLYALSPQLARLPYRQGIASVLMIVAAATMGVVQMGGELYLPPYEHDGIKIWRYIFLGVASAALLLFYFHLRARALSPAIYEARLQALQARIRPHFLFNCINTVLSIVRDDPKRAEIALEDMSDLFRMAMAQDSKLVLLSREVELSRRYLALEQLRLGERLKVDWHTENLPDDALIPPLMLQPLLENAVYHGIEPLAEGGTIDIRLGQHDNEMHLEIYNPRPEPGSHHTGNKLALANIRERLALLFDIEAHYTVESSKEFYRIHIIMPYVRKELT
jgi:two-component system, LytTR family, sensor histidine kinase AlgZ